MNVNPSTHVTRASRIYFDGSPESGRVDVRCKGRVPFSLVRSDTNGWIILLGDADQKLRSVLQDRVVRPNAKAAYFFAISQVWGKK